MSSLGSILYVVAMVAVPVARGEGPITRPEVSEKACPVEVVEIAVPRDEVVRRLSGRRVCRACGTMFNTAFQPPEGCCDRCGGALYQRDDDREETVGRRLDVFRQETAPVLAHYKKKSLLRRVSGMGSPADVFGRITAEVQ